MLSRVAVFGTYNADVHPRVAVLRDGLAAAGLDVVECNRPIGISTAERVRLVRQPWRIVLVVLRLLAVWVGLAGDARRAGPVDAVVVGYLGHLDVHLARLLFPGVPVVLDLLILLADTAADRGVGGGWRTRVLRWFDERAISAADIVLVDTEEHLRMLPADRQAAAVVVQVGAPAAWLQPPAPRGDGPLRVVFFGLYTPLQGATAIGEAIARLSGRDDIVFTMIGDGQDRPAAQLAAGDARGCTWVDWAEPAELPAIVAAHHVCLGVFGAGPKARRVVPNKVYQGAAAGCAIVTSDTPPQRRVLGEAAVLVEPDDAAALAAALAALADEPQRLESLRLAAHELAVAEFHPARIISPVLERLAGDVGA